MLIPVLLLNMVFLFGAGVKKQSIPWLGLVFSALALAGFLLDALVASIRAQAFFALPFVFFASALILVSLIINIVLYIVFSGRFSQRIKLIEAVPSNIESNIYAYLNKQSKVILFTDQFYDIFEDLVTKKKNWFEGITKLACNNQGMTMKEFRKFLKTEEEMQFTLDLLLVNNQTMKLELSKQKAMIGDKLAGFILINQKLTLSEVFRDGVVADYKKRLYAYFDLLEESLAYFDFDKKRYVLTKAMARLLNAKETEITTAAFEKMIVPEDLKALEKRQTSDQLSQIHYRMITINGQEWFEENSQTIEGRLFMAIHRHDFTKVKMNFKGYPELLSDCNGYLDKNLDFGLAFVSINDLPKINDILGSDGSDLVVIKYFTKLNESSLNGKIKVYRISKMEYGIIIDRLDNYDLILRDLKNNVSELLGLDIYFNEKKFELKNSVGIVSSKNVSERTPEALVKAGFDALFYATDEKYPKRYSIYYAKKPATSEPKPEDVKIDLSDSFLDSILKK